MVRHSLALPIAILHNIFDCSSTATMEVSAISFAREWDSVRLADKMAAYYTDIATEWTAEPISQS